MILHHIGKFTYKTKFMLHKGSKLFTSLILCLGNSFHIVDMRVMLKCPTLGQVTAHTSCSLTYFMEMWKRGFQLFMSIT